MFNTCQWFFTISDIAGLLKDVEKKSWFEDWFDSPYYHVLYAHRDEDEAEHFIRNLTSYLKVNSNQSALDLACGKGRHSIMLNDLGLAVTGLDLSPASIQAANASESKTLQFNVGDMRSFTLNQKFDFVFNFFTSFGYFESKEENLQVLRRVKEHLNAQGLLIIDFLNPVEIEKSLVKSEELERDGVKFQISRSIQDGFILKNIRVQAEGIDKYFQERVQALTLNDFEQLLNSAGFEIQDTFGSYNLDDFSENNSKRLILIAEQKG